MAKKLDERGPGGAEEPEFIQTIPKQGYRLVAPVSWEEVKETPLTKSESVATAGLAPSRVDAGGTRLTFRWEGNHAYEVRCEDYHS